MNRDESTLKLAAEFFLNHIDYELAVDLYEELMMINTEEQQYTFSMTVALQRAGRTSNKTM